MFCGIKHNDMKTKMLIIVSKSFIGFSIFSSLYVSFLSLVSPQATMDLVQTNLPNTDALSSIRGIYGGVGLSICLALIYLLFENFKQALWFLGLFWGAYAMSRLITILVDGPLGNFGNQWIVIETIFCLIALGLSFANRDKK